MLFSKNLIKVLIATETFAVGLNMPTKTVIFTDVFKYDNNGKRRLATHEFIQMSGRAGRRGIDTKGFVIITPQLFSEDVSSRELENLLFGSSQKIQSKFNIDHQWVLSVIQNNALDRIEELTSKSLLNSELSKETQTTKHQISKLDTLISSINLNNPELYEEYQTLYNQLNNIIKPSNNQMKKLEQKIKELKPKLVEFDKYNELMKHKKEHEESSKYLVTLNNYIRSEVDNQIRILKKLGFITDDNQLTQYGQIAIKISELDSITTTNILVSEYLDGLFYTKNHYKILALFTLICDGKGNDDYEIQEAYHDVLKFIREIGDIKINRELLCPVLDWYDGKYSREIVETYEIHEGDLIKSINKIIHLLDEVVQVFILINKVEYIDIITEIKNKLIGEPGRNIITMESLYLKIV
jgi:superfamily II RNA helicase